MNLPTLDLASLPRLDTPTGLFGSAGVAAAMDDRTVLIMTMVYDANIADRDD